MHHLAVTKKHILSGEIRIVQVSFYFYHRFQLFIFVKNFAEPAFWLQRKVALKITKPFA